MTRSRTAFALAAGATGSLVLLSASPALADNHTATVSVLHGVPDAIEGRTFVRGKMSG